MAGMPRFSDPRLLVGSENYDDAGVVLINEDTVLIQTLDFFTPTVDDPYMFGQIAAANALSDVYAMGGTPLTAMNIAAFPTCLPFETLQEILRGGADKIMEAGAMLVGGHTIEDDEPKYGLSVTGIAHPSQITANNQAKVGDLLFLTKPLGSGIIMTGIKAGVVSADLERRLSIKMAELNKLPAEAMSEVGVNSATDITGFSLLGHLHEMAEASKLGAELWYKEIPMWEEALELAKDDYVPGGASRNRNYLRSFVEFAKGIPFEVTDVLYDPQTSGGLLIAVAPEKAALLEVALEKREVEYSIIGKLVEGEKIIVK